MCGVALPTHLLGLEVSAGGMTGFLHLTTGTTSASSTRGKEQGCIIMWQKWTSAAALLHKLSILFDVVYGI